MTRQYKKKLIEVAIPLDVINAASTREKSIRHGHPSTLHLWWARRPLAACRAVLFAQLVDDPSERVEELLGNSELQTKAEKELAVRLEKRRQERKDGSTDAADKGPAGLEDVIVELERRRLFAIIGKLVRWENSTNRAVLERARAEIRRSCDGDLPPVCDPFSGGGSIPLEAQRLGLPAFGSDLNPVAVMISKAMIEIPPKFRDQPPMHPGVRERQFYRNAEGLAEDVRHYGAWMRNEAWSRIGHLYPQVDLPEDGGGGKASVIAWIWARTVPSPDPAFCDVQVPIASSFLLSSKPGRKGAFIEPVVDRQARTIAYRIRRGGTKDEIARAREGTKAGRGAHFRCLLSGTAITPDYVKSKGKAGQMGQTLMAIVAEGKTGRAYVAPTDEHVASACTPQFVEIANKCRDTFLSGETPSRLTGGTCHGYGLNQWGKLFTDRQLVVLNTFSDLVHEARAQVERDALRSGLSDDGIALRDGGSGAKAYAEAVSVYLGFVVDRGTDYWSSIATWMPRGTVGHLFARHAIPMTWDFPEANPLADSFHCSFVNSVEWVSKSIQNLPAKNVGEIRHVNAQDALIQGNVISTDPPYYDNIGYADLSDFFYGWLKRALRDVYPDLFSFVVATKAEELVATPYRHGGREAAEAFFLDGMSRAVANMARQASDLFPATIYYAFRQSEIAQEGISSTGWATFLQAVIDAGFSVVGTWPVRTERSARSTAIGTNALANSVVLVCRKRAADAGVITRTEFIRALKRELPPAIAALKMASIAPADMPQSAIGPGMGIFSRHGAVLEADDSPMPVKTALQLINHELDAFLNDVQGEFDADTRFAITWFEQNGMATGDFGTANNLATARGLSVGSVKQAGIVESRAGRVRILRRDELPDGWDPNADTHPTVWACCQHLVRTLENDGEHAAAVLLRKIGADRAAAARDLAYCLYDICTNKRGDANEATSYNALIAVWPDLIELAARIHETDPDGDPQTAMNL